MRIDEEPEDDEERDLQEPRQPVEEGLDTLLVDELLVPHEYTHDIDGEVAIAMQERGGGEGEEDEAQEEDGVECPVADVGLINQEGSDVAREIPHQTTDGELQYEGHEDACP